MSGTYNVVFTGELLDGFDLESVQKAFADIFKLNQEKVNNYFNGKPKVLKKEVSHAVAAKYKSRIESVGGKIKIQPISLENVVTEQAAKIPEVISKPAQEQKTETIKVKKVETFDSGINLIEKGRLNQTRKLQTIEVVDDKSSKVLMLIGIVFIIFGLIDFSLELLRIFSMTGTFVLSVSAVLIGLIVIKSSRAS